MVQLKPIPET